LKAQKETTSLAGGFHCMAASNWHEAVLGV